MNRTRILYVIDSMAKGGAEAQLFKTLMRLDSDKFEAFVILSREAGSHSDQLAALPIIRDITILDDARCSSILSLLKKVLKFRKLVEAAQPMIIHSWLWYSNFLCGLAHQFSLSAHIPLIISQRGDYDARYGRFRLWLTRKIVYNNADAILTNSDCIQDNLRKRYIGKPILAIPNIIDLPDPSASHLFRGRSERENAHYLDSSTQHIVSVGRLAREKGHVYLIEALNRLHMKFDFSNFTATILGDGELKDELSLLVDRYHLSDRIHLPGFCDDIFPILSTADLFILPSLHEGSPNALIEAMGVGIPCVASDVGGVGDLIKNEKSGMLVPAADPEALARSIHRILTNRELAEHLGKHARLKIHRAFDNEQSIQQLEAVYRNCLEISNPG